MRNIIESNLKPEAEHSSPTPDVQGFMLDYKTIYYAKDVTYAELVDYVCRFDYPKSKAISTINKFINDGSIMQVRGIELLPLLKVNELKTLLRTFGLKVSGKKAELIDRLKENVSRVELEKLLPKTTKLIEIPPPYTGGSYHGKE